VKGFWLHIGLFDDTFSTADGTCHEMEASVQVCGVLERIGSTQ
jgi:hypothetical protein